MARRSARLRWDKACAATLWAAVVLLHWAGCSDDPTTSSAANANNGVPGGVQFGDTGGVQSGDGAGQAATDGAATGSAADGQATGEPGEDAEGTDSGGASAQDGGPAAGEVGAPCEDGSACDSGFCVQDVAGKVCSKVCVENCPAGWTCAQVNLGSGDTTWLCLPEASFACLPCTASTQCNHPGQKGNLCVPFGTTGSFCGLSCNPALPSPCPAGSQCQATKDPDTGAASHQCLPPDGICACSALAKQRGATTTCTHENFFGKCQGKRVCKAEGLTACDAPLPEAEICDGVDNDCNGQTDEMAVQTQECEQTNAHGTCKGKVKACLAGSTVCDAPTPAQETCNGLDDDCDGQTDNGLCDDGDPCTLGSCNPDGSCKQSPAEGKSCDDGNACTDKDLCVAGQCVGGSAKSCDDANPCTADACDPLQGCGNTPNTGPCADDGDPCTVDVCAAGQCGHVAGNDGKPCADDGKACTADLCSLGNCTHPAAAKGAACEDDGKPCTDDVCDGAFSCVHPPKASVCTIGGVCVGEGDKKPGEPCLGCNPKLSTTQWVQMSGAPCDDGDVCTVSDTCAGAQCKGQPIDCTGLSDVCAVGQCVGGKCTAIPKAAGTSCNDGDACTVSDACSGGKCQGKAKNCASLDSTCAQGVCSGGSCVAKAINSGAACGDGDLCTVSDVCVSGQCKGTPKNCSSYSDACNTGSCSGGACVKLPKANGTYCSDGDVCTSSDKCASGKCVGTTIKDAFEPNDSAPGKKLADKVDCDGASTLYASISPKGETDWYTFHAQDKSFCTIRPSASISYMAGNYDICLYFKCDNGKTGSSTVSCDNGSHSAGGPYGTYGCCSSLPGTQTDLVKIGPKCSTLGAGDESGTLYVRVRPQNSSQACGSYKLTWSAKK